MVNFTRKFQIENILGLFLDHSNPYVLGLPSIIENFSFKTILELELRSENSQNFARKFQLGNIYSGATLKNLQNVLSKCDDT